MQFLDFSELTAVGKLQEYAGAPCDLTEPDLLSSRRFSRYHLSSCGFDLLYATQRLDDRVLTGLQELADEAGLIEKFLAMKQGAVMNRIEGFPSEERQVLHTSSRDVFRENSDHPPSAHQAKKQLARLRTFLEDLQSGRIVNQSGESFTTMIQVGIGGSDLGPRALCLALAAYGRTDHRVDFISNVDPDDAARVLAGVDLSRTLVNVVSKSGTTLETVTNERLVRDAFARDGLDPARHILAVTGKGSPMDDPARYLTTFHMYDYIGGRYSVTSMVGMVTLGFLLGYDRALEILSGAHAMDRAAEEKDIRKNMPLLMAMIGIWNHNFLGFPTIAILPYSQALVRFPAHLQQCDMESNGKSVTRLGGLVRWQTGPVVWGEPGTNGQHAFYQLLHQGTEIVPADFIGFRRCQHGRDFTVKGTTSQQKLVANMLAQSLALARGKSHDNPNKYFPGNRPSSILLADQLTPYTMGALLALYEHRIVFQGLCWNINSFDQEGVQLGKALANRLLAELSGDDAGEQGLPENSPEKSLLRLANISK